MLARASSRLCAQQLRRFGATCVSASPRAVPCRGRRRLTHFPRRPFARARPGLRACCGLPTCRNPSSRGVSAVAAGEVDSRPGVGSSHFPDVTSNPVENDLELTSAVFTVGDRPGALKEALGLFEKHKVNLTHLESKPSKASGAWDFDVAFMGAVGSTHVQELLKELTEVCAVKIAPPKEVPWFPRSIGDLDKISQKTLDAGSDLESDHPGFNDPEYRRRREAIVEIALNYKHGQSIPPVDYSADEVQTWGSVYRKLGEFFPSYACRQFLDILPDMERHSGYGADRIPQLQDISDYLQSRTGFSLRPVGGLLSGRDFLNALAFRVFFSTQYIRHHSVPLYTPEPDICHELMGHAPMFADPDFADFSHEIGLASLGASDRDIVRLATLYWFAVEFSVCKEGGQKKAVGAGLLSSFGELEYACSATRPAGGTDEWPEYLPFDPWVASETEFPITTYQPKYFVAESLHDLKVKTRSFCDSLSRPFRVRYDFDSRGVAVDRAVRQVYTEEQITNMAGAAEGRTEAA